MGYLLGHLQDQEEAPHIEGAVAPTVQSMLAGWGIRENHLLRDSHELEQSGIEREEDNVSRVQTRHTNQYSDDKVINPLHYRLPPNGPPTHKPSGYCCL